MFLTSRRFWKRVFNLTVNYAVIASAPLWVVPAFLFTLTAAFMRRKHQNYDDMDTLRIFLKGDRFLFNDSSYGIREQDARHKQSFERFMTLVLREELIRARKRERDEINKLLKQLKATP